MIHTLGTEFVHFYLLEDDDELTLVDAGCRGYRPMLDATLAGLGRTPADIRAIVLTHADPDHVGFAGELQRDHQIPVYVHRADSQRARDGTTKSTEGSGLAMLGMLRHRHARGAARHMISHGAAKQPPVAEVLAFDDGDQLPVPGRLRAIHTPGHTDGHCLLFAPAQEALFVGDALNNVDIMTGRAGPHLPPAAANTSTAQALQSLSRVEQIDPRILYFGHGSPSTDSARELVAEARARHRPTS